MKHKGIFLYNLNPSQIFEILEKIKKIFYKRQNKLNNLP